MNKEDYIQYYIQGSDHYLIPKDVFIELFNEMSNWREEVKELKKQLDGIREERDYLFNKLSTENKNLKVENKELKKQLEERPKEYVFIGNAQNKTRDFINQITKDNKEYKNQQKEFIDYINAYIKLLKDKPDLVEEGQKDILEEILSKYKEIIGDDK